MTIKPDAALAAAKSIAAQVSTEDGRTPLERVLARHWSTVSSWREAGWTWRQIASLLTRAGVRLRNGDPLTDKYLAAVASRLNRSSSKQAVQGGSVLAGEVTKPGRFGVEGRSAADPPVRKSFIPERAKAADVPRLSVGSDRKEEIRERMSRASKSRAGT